MSFKVVGGFSLERILNYRETILIAFDLKKSFLSDNLK